MVWCHWYLALHLEAENDIVFREQPEADRGTGRLSPQACQQMAAGPGFFSPLGQQRGFFLFQHSTVRYLAAEGTQRLFAEELGRRFEAIEGELALRQAEEQAKAAREKFVFRQLCFLRELNSHVEYAPQQGLSPLPGLKICQQALKDRYVASVLPVKLEQ